MALVYLVVSSSTREPHCLTTDQKGHLWIQASVNQTALDPWLQHIFFHGLAV